MVFDIRYGTDSSPASGERNHLVAIDDESNKECDDNER
jgi:hypothetical protein